MSIDYPYELQSLKDDAEKLHATVVRFASYVADIREHLDELIARSSVRGPELPIVCRHETPIGDYCAYCNETPEG